MSNRFDYVAYDAEANELQKSFKEAMVALDEKAQAIGQRAINQKGVTRELAGEIKRYESLVRTHLEETYAFMGKLVREDQIARNGSAELQEARGNE